MTKTRLLFVVNNAIVPKEQQIHSPTSQLFPQSQYLTHSRSAALFAAFDCKLNVLGHGVLENLVMLRETVAGVHSSLFLSLICSRGALIEIIAGFLRTKCSSIRLAACLCFSEIAHTFISLQPRALQQTAPSTSQQPEPSSMHSEGEGVTAPLNPLSFFISNILPTLDSTVSSSLNHRKGVVELIWSLLLRLDLQIVPYLSFLIAPLLAQMSEFDEQVRSVASQCFAYTVRLMPLEGSAENPPDFTIDLRNKRKVERAFISQLLDTRTLQHHEIPVKINAKLREYQQLGVDWLNFLNRYQLHGILCDGWCFFDFYLMIAVTVHPSTFIHSNFIFRHGFGQNSAIHLHSRQPPPSTPNESLRRFSFRAC